MASFIKKTTLKEKNPDSILYKEFQRRQQKNDYSKNKIK